MTTITDLPENILQKIMNFPYMVDLDYEMTRRTCKKLFMIPSKHWPPSPTTHLYTRAMSAGYINILNWLHTQKHDSDKFLLTMFSTGATRSALIWLYDNDYILHDPEIMYIPSDPRTKPAG